MSHKSEHIHSLTPLRKQVKEVSDSLFSRLRSTARAGQLWPHHPQVPFLRPVTHLMASGCIWEWLPLIDSSPHGGEYVLETIVYELNLKFLCDRTSAWAAPELT